MGGDILVLNTGSSSIKFALFGPGLLRGPGGRIDEIGSRAHLVLQDHATPVDAADHDAALAAIFAALRAEGVQIDRLAAVAHRVVHGGPDLDRAAILTPDLERVIEGLSDLAPLHNPPILAGIRAVRAQAPEMVQIASFDTAFHATIPPVTHRYAIPAAEAAKGLRRYGFHGISFASLVRHLPEISGAPLPARLLACHLGNGSSLCAIRDGRSVATTMGYSPVSGLTMGSRSGEIDANAVLRMAQDHGIDAAGDILNRTSGLRALGGASDMRALRADHGADAAFAIAHFTQSILMQGGAMIAAMGGLDAIAFTGGIGENDAALRADVLEGFGWLGARIDAAANAAGKARISARGSSIAAYIVPAQEEREIARDALELLVAGQPP